MIPSAWGYDTLSKGYHKTSISPSQIPIRPLFGFLLFSRYCEEFLALGAATTACPDVYRESNLRLRVRDIADGCDCSKTFIN